MHLCCPCLGWVHRNLVIVTRRRIMRNDDEMPEALEILVGQKRD